MAAQSCGHKQHRRIYPSRRLVVDSSAARESVEKNTKTMFNSVIRSFMCGLYSCRYTKLLQVIMITLLLLSQNVRISSASYEDGSYDSMDYKNPGLSDNSMDSDNSFDPQGDMNTCLHGEYLKGYTLAGGTKAGDYDNLGTVESFEECAELCCQDQTCKIAIMLTSPKSMKKNCFKIACYDPESDMCRVKSTRHSKYQPHLFRRGEDKLKLKKVATSEGSSHSIITNEVKSMCRMYTGTVCSGTIDKTKLYFYTSSNDSGLDTRLQGPIDQISSRLSGLCRDIAVQAICYRFYPQCDDPSQPKPIHVCDNECDALTYGECAADFAESNMLTYLQHVIPNCGVSDDNKKRRTAQSELCIKLKAKTTPEKFSSPTNITATMSQQPHTSMPSFLQSTLPQNLVTLSNVSSTTVKSQDYVQNTQHNKTFTAAREETFASAVTSAQLTTKILESVKNEMPVIVNVTGTTDAGTGFEEVTPKPSGSKIPSTVAPTTHNTIKPGDEIRVSAGDDTEIRSPVNQVTLYASTWPKESFDGEYSYAWMQIVAPENSHGYIEGKTSKNVKLTQLDIPGVYKFALKVTSVMGKQGTGYVTITVKGPTRVNHPPRAEVSPKEQTIQLPTNTVILDGSKSSDDDKIVAYKWEEIKGPIKENTVFGSDTGSKLLQLQNLIAGEYHFKLTVTDSDGETDSMEAVVIVKEEKDYPPKANAGHDIIIRLPNNSVILNGNQSSDDKGNLKYAWSKSADSPRCDMLGTDRVWLQISSLVEGTYVFTLRVTDSNDQSDESQVKVIVLPEINTKPVAIAGDDKELKYPDTSTTLDGSASTDNSKIASYKWEKLSGPESITMVGSDSVKVHLSDLVVGTYVMRLTVTDDKNLVGSDTVQITVKKDHNEPPSAVINDRIQTIYLPTHTAVVDGSHSTDDEMITTYLWTRGGSSPAAGDVINDSDHSPVLHLANLVKGKYIFDLTVKDEKGETGQASAIITVEENPDKLNIVQMYLDIDIMQFTEESKKNLIRKISVILEVDRKLVKIIEIASVHYNRGIMVRFIVEDPNIPDRKFDGKYISDLLKHKIGTGGKLFDFTMLRVEPYVCRNNCSNHGYCDAATKLCVCDTFWMSNFFKAQMGEKESNCDWSVLYMSVTVFAIFLLFLGLTWSVFYLLARKKRSKRRARYRALRSVDPDGADDEILLIPKAMKEKFTANSLTFTESDEDSEEETTVFDKNRVSNGRLSRSVNGHIRPNGHGNSKIRDRAM